MISRFASNHRAPRRKSLALSISALFVLSPGLAAASTWVVNSCDEGSSGSLMGKTGTLRFAAEHAVSGDVINMSGLVCAEGRISLATGAIAFGQDSITISGPGAAALRIDASDNNPGATGDNRVFTHIGGGKLTVQHLGFAGGHVYHIDAAYTSQGGCLYSKGSVDLVNVTVSDCGAQSNANVARGGAVYAIGDLKLSHSVVTGSDAGGSTAALGGGVYTKGVLKLEYSKIDGNTAFSTTSAQGGGAFAGGYASVQYSTINGNHAGGTLASARGGGLTAGGGADITYSTVSNNASDGNFGGVFDSNAKGYDSGKLTITSSTVSGNSAAGLVGGVYTYSAKAFMTNSTVAFNTAVVGKSTGYLAPGFAVGAKNYTLDVSSSILSNNTYAAIENDMSVASSVSVGGTDNLVRVAQAVVFAGSTISACPLLGPLRDNGGLTWTHALLSGSPAVDTGNSYDVNSYDQRSGINANGTRDYYRESGPIGENNPRADIGAYEVQQDDIVFNSGFDGCN